MDIMRKDTPAAPSYPPTGPHVTFPESTPDTVRHHPDAPDAVPDDGFADFVPRWWPESGPDAE